MGFLSSLNNLNTKIGNTVKNAVGYYPQAQQQQMEATVAQQNALINSGQAHWEFQGDGSQILVSGPTPQNNTNGGFIGPINPNQGQTSGTSGSSGSGSILDQPQEVQPNNQSLLGQMYDLNSPDGLSQYLQAKKNYIDATNRDQLKQIDFAFKNATGGTDRNVNINNVGGDYGTQKTNFLQSIADALSGYAKGQNRDLGDINSYYGGLGDITQSSQNVRQANTIGDYNQQIGQTQTSKTQGMGSLEQALSNYLNQDQQQRAQVATGYQNATDALANNVQSDIQAKQAVPITLASQYGGVVPTAYQGQIDRNTQLLDSLQGSSGNLFKNFGTTNGNVNSSDILKYLYNGG